MFFTSFRMLFIKACGCVCGRGHLRKDCDWKKPTGDAEDKQKNRRKVGPAKSVSATKSNSSAAQLMMNNQIRHRANSLSSTGSTASSSGSSSPPETVASAGPVVFFLKKKQQTTTKPTTEEESGSSGLFAHRVNFSSFNVLPRHKLNSYHIKVRRWS